MRSLGSRFLVLGSAFAFVVCTATVQAQPAKPQTPPSTQAAPPPTQALKAPQPPSAQSAQPAAPAPAPQRGAAPAPAPAQPAAPAALLPQPENYTYNADGRRDPFISLIGTGANVDSRTPVRGEGGAAAIAVADISVRGIMQSRNTLVAMVEGPNKKTYIVHQGDKLLDGVIKTITPTGLVVIQEVNDPLSLVKQREVSKLLRSLEGGK